MVPYIKRCIAAVDDREGGGGPNAVDDSMGVVADVGAKIRGGGMSGEDGFLEFEG